LQTLATSPTQMLSQAVLQQYASRGADLLRAGIARGRELGAGDAGAVTQPPPLEELLLLELLELPPLHESLQMLATSPTQMLSRRWCSSTSPSRRSSARRLSHDPISAVPAAQMACAQRGSWASPVSSGAAAVPQPMAQTRIEAPRNATR